MPRREYTEVEGVRIHSEHHGEGPPVVLLHGLSGSRRWWRFTIPALAKRYSVHVPELVGFGRTRRQGRQPSMPELAALVGSWMTTLGIERPALVGHSMGGQTAMHVAAAGIELRALVLVDASGVPRDYTAAQAARFVAGVLPPRSWGSPTFIPRIALDAARAGPRTLISAGWKLLRDDVRPLLERIEVPTLIVWGLLDPLVPRAHGEVLAEGIRGARLVVFEDAAHNVMCDRPHDFNRVLLDFLDRA